MIIKLSSFFIIMLFFSFQGKSSFEEISIESKPKQSTVEIEQLSDFSDEEEISEFSEIDALIKKETISIKTVRSSPNLTRSNSIKSDLDDLDLNYNFKRSLKIEQPKKFIMSLDGGGIRGIIPSLILSEMDKDLKKPIATYFDVFGGTSTGGIISSGLNIPATAKIGSSVVSTYDESYGKNHPKFSPADLLKLYETRGGEIFQKKCFLLKWFTNAQFYRNGLDSILNQYFGTMPMSDSLKPLLLTTYDISRGKPFLMQSHLPKMLSKDSCFSKKLNIPLLKKIHTCLDVNNPRFRLLDAVKATSAAPTYFSPVKIYSLNDRNKLSTEHYTMVDGGIYANNPVLPTLEYARFLFPNTALKNFRTLSIGTGEPTISHTYNQVNKWTMVQWLNPIITMMMDGGSDLNHMIADTLLNSSLYGSGEKYLRLNNELIYANGQLGDFSKTNVDNLKKDAFKIMDKNESKITKFIRSLENNKEDFTEEE